MMFFFKEKPIEIIAFCNPEFRGAAEYTPIKPANKFYPQWWKDLGGSRFNWDNFSPERTIKSCAGVINIFQTGFIMPSWSDLALEIGNGGWKYRYSDERSSLMVHPNEMMGEFYNDHVIFKLHSPWLLRSPVNILSTEPFYLHRSSDWPFITPYGITPPLSKKNLHATNVFLLAKKEEEVKKIMIKANTPLVHFIPLTDKKINFKVEVPEPAEFRQFELLLGTDNRFANRGLKNAFDTKNNK
jgi:hypothetical protein